MKKTQIVNVIYYLLITTQIENISPSAQCSPKYDVNSQLHNDSCLSKSSVQIPKFLQGIASHFVWQLGSISLLASWLASLASLDKLTTYSPIINPPRQPTYPLICMSSLPTLSKSSGSKPPRFTYIRLLIIADHSIRFETPDISPGNSWWAMPAASGELTPLFPDLSKVCSNTCPVTRAWRST